jgi:hypothetical protein
MELSRHNLYRGIIFLVANLFSVLGLFYIYDITPPVLSKTDQPQTLEFYANNSTAKLDPGVYVGNAGDVMGIEPATGVIFSAAIAAILFNFVLWIHAEWYQVLLASIVLNLVLIAGLIEYAPFISNTRDTILSPALLPATIIGHSLLIGLLSATLSNYIIPDNFNSLNKSKTELFIYNQWRFARVAIAPVIAFIVGISIPISSNLVNEPPVFRALFAVWAAFALPVVGVAGFFVLRVYECQNEYLTRDEFRRPPLF